MTNATKAALAGKAAAAMPRKPEPKPFVKWVRTTAGGLQRVAMPSFVAGSSTPPEGWAVEGSPEEAAMKQAAEGAPVPVPATQDWQAVSTLPAKPQIPETEAERKASLANPEYGTLEYLETVKWPVGEKGETAESWEAWRARQPWAAEAAALAAEVAETPRPVRLPPPVRRPPPVGPKTEAKPSSPPPTRRPPPIPPRRAPT
ncbi:MAG: hypothetical protein MEP57_09910 [Microvirga sp.]|nr:hypothetical protein [Microvirga sp.]